MKRLNAVLIFGLLFSAFCFAQTQTGDATYNASKSGLTIAHSSMSFNTRVRVTNLRNNREVIATVDGRIPVSDPRIADISKEAGDAIGMSPQGYTLVRLEQLVPQQAPDTASTADPAVASGPATGPATGPASGSGPAVSPAAASGAPAAPAPAAPSPSPGGSPAPQPPVRESAFGSGSFQLISEPTVQYIPAPQNLCSPLCLAILILLIVAIMLLTAILVLLLCARRVPCQPGVWVYRRRLKKRKA
jgi:rare lipoprotein A